MKIRLTENQDAAVTNMQTDIETQGYALVKCGQRSGKSVMTLDLIKRTGYKKVCWLSHRSFNRPLLVNSIKVLSTELGVYDVEFTHRLPRSKDGPVEERTLVVIDDAMWFSGSYNVFNAARGLKCDVAVISSRGPEYDRDLRWHELKGQSFHTWELNPKVTRASLQAEYEKCPTLAARDFERF